VRSGPPGRVVFLGGGSVGSYTGGMLAAAGHEVALIDGWPEHVEAVLARGLTIATPEGDLVARPEAWHLGEAWRLRAYAPEAAFLTVKLYDTAWAAALLAQWLPAGVPVVTLQNALVEEVVAHALGWGRVLGCIGGGLDVSMRAPGVVQRSRRRHATPAPVFKLGEAHGRSTPRAERLAALLDEVDRAVVTTDLWTQRWEKLCANAMTTGLSGLSGYSLREVYTREDTRWLAVRLAAEALVVGEALGFEVPKLFGEPAATWRDAGRGHAAAREAAMAALAAQAASMVEGGMSGTLQDLRKGRPSEVEYLNGFVEREAKRLGIPAAAHALIAKLIRQVERGERVIGPDAITLIEEELS
jgi:2-dehydropantoate 2-reductase